MQALNEITPPSSSCAFVSIMSLRLSERDVSADSSMQHAYYGLDVSIHRRHFHYRRIAQISRDLFGPNIRWLKPPKMSSF